MEFVAEEGNQFRSICSTLILPALSIGNVGQFTVNLSISSIGAQKIGFLDDPNVLPCVGNDAYGPVPQDELALPLEAYELAPSKLSVGNPMTFYLWLMIAGVFYHLYNQSSYQVLDEISPLTFSVGNTMKRVVVIVATVLVFRNPVQPLNALGSAIAIFGTFLYSQATAKKKKVVEGEKSN